MVSRDLLPMAGHQSAAAAGAQIINSLGIGPVLPPRASRCGNPCWAPFQAGTRIAAAGEGGGHDSAGQALSEDPQWTAYREGDRWVNRGQKKSLKLVSDRNYKVI